MVHTNGSIAFYFTNPLVKNVTLVSSVVQLLSLPDSQSLALHSTAPLRPLTASSVLNPVDSIDSDNPSLTPLVASDDNTLESVLGPVRDPLATTITMTIIYAIIFVTGSIGNVCTCIVIKRNRYMHTTVNYYLFSLAISDLLLLNFGLPPELYALWRKYPYIFGKWFCILRAFTSETSTNASILTITAFTVERYLAICHPLRAHTMSKLSRAIKVILIIWAISAIAAIPIAYPFDIIYMVKHNNGQVNKESAICSIASPVEYLFEVATICFFVLPMGIISILYILIGIRLRRSSSITSRADSNGDRSPDTHLPNGSKDPTLYNQQSYKQHLDKRRAIVRMLVAVVVSFFICWSPFHAQRVLAIHVAEKSPKFVQTTLIVLTHVSGITYYLTATINPILYQLLSLKFRLAFRDTFGFWPPFLKPDHLPELSTSIGGGSQFVPTLGSLITDNSSVKICKKTLSTNGSFHQIPSPVSRKGGLSSRGSNGSFFNDLPIEPKSPGSFENC
ncbi:pyrokinin-1 receptor-like [Tetranychus urticae]|uniref:G-protein coupled receptors family 1 profile domain-containing protein n=1 Tax=Tetranychus urticae TaxID=32264 RepID=T1K4B5_TETUR|nr:pyrokinin-1 receptor-like [Tetranychus urticae]XP_025016187.1 pyrokinin-1 receptor-like [Tetranychus urticae]XP_025016188.1 pyrokinin-1 receptor-like [Tetranychus urticae]XP_025016189.1 pyrokinin-1 receptor-like [Tetranychus urticae]